MDQPPRIPPDNSHTALSVGSMPHVLFREIHKNAFLKKHSSERRAGFPRKSERVWVVFCVHDDVEAFLEMYPDQKVALTHKPEWFTSLAHALHVSPSICGHEDEFEFAITLSTQVIRLAAPSWESMMEWVDTIRNKLRELKVLSPKENLYSKMPEQKLPLLPTRDPNSPLPLPPDGPSTLLPGVEPVHLDTRNALDSSEPQRIQRNHERRFRQESESHSRDTSQVNEPSTSEITVPENEVRSRISLNRTVSVPDSSSAQRIISIPTCSNITVIEVSCSSKKNSHSISECNPVDYDNAHGDADSDDVFVTPPITPKSNASNVCESPGAAAPSTAHYEHVFLPNSLVTIDSGSVSVNYNQINLDGSENNGSSHEDLNEENRKLVVQNVGQEIQSKLEKVTISGMIPRLPAKVKCEVGKRNHQGCSKDSEEGQHQEQSEIVRTDDGSSSSGVAYSQVKKKGRTRGEGRSQEQRMVSPVPVRRKPPEDDGEVTRSDVANSNMARSKMETKSGNGELNARKSKHGSRSDGVQDSVPSTSGNVTRIVNREGLNHNNNVDVEPLTATVQPAVGVISVEDIPLIGGHQRRRRRSSSSEAATSSNAVRGIGGADRIRINVPLTGREVHREEGDGRCLDVRNEAEPTQVIGKSSARLTLREQQVLQLRREMMHPGGVRLQLRRKECVGSIALVDALSGVWVAGWKQREHPMLYNALHIGDQLVSVSDVVVRSASDAQKIIRSSSNMYIELIIRRVPFGRVFALHRSEGQSLGIVQEGNTAEIRDVLPNSSAARAGLSPKTPSVDGLSLTTWFLTEINGRPLNLFFKDNEVRDRLNAVGKDISVLVQPHDFIKQIKKNLKNIRSYKDYIVQ